MKKLMTMLGAAGMVLAACAAVNDTLISFSTPGTDVYKDGTPVLDGECYALVWSSDGSFEGIKADGSPVDANDRIVLVAPVAKNGRCPSIVYQVNATLAAELAGGQYGVYLLDTRVVGADGEKKVSGVDGHGALKSVNGGVAVSGGESAGAGFVATVATTAVGGASITAYSQIDLPKITAVEMRGARISLTVAGMLPVAEYKVLKGVNPGEISTELEATVRDDTFEFEKPRDSGTFFKVIGLRKIK